MTPTERECCEKCKGEELYTDIFGGCKNPACPSCHKYVDDLMKEVADQTLDDAITTLEKKP